ncbi:MAG: hypothetical protein RIR26_1698 [Pseudomonadota bacterium]|jgi:hypothetical protein
MKTDWAEDDVHALARLALGSDSAVIADLFPRVVNAIYLQEVSNSQANSDQAWSVGYRQLVLKELPTTCEEVLPFFVRMVWNKSWTPATHPEQVRELASRFVQVVQLAGGSLTLEELMTACESAF